MEWIFVVLFLAFIWSFLWNKRRRDKIPERGPDARHLLARQAESAAAAAHRDGKHEEAQLHRLSAAWLHAEPPLGIDDPPEQLDPNNYKHLVLIDTIRQRYATLLSDAASPFAHCTFKPTAHLPYPKAYIEQALRVLLRVGRGEVTSQHIGPDVLSEDDVAVIKGSLQTLETFIDVSPEELPADPDANMQFGTEHVATRGETH